MLVFSWLPIALFSAVMFIVGGVSFGVEMAERRRLARHKATAPRRKRFLPVVIQGGRVDAAVVVSEAEKLAG